MVDVGLRRGRVSADVTQLVRPDRRRATPRWFVLRPTVLSVVVCAVIMALTTASSITVAVVNDANENRLERLQARQTATLVQSFIQNLATPLASAAEIASVTGGDSPSFRRYVSSFMAKQTRFVSLSLWSVSATNTRVLTVIDRAPQLGTTGPAATAFVRKAATAGAVSVNGILTGTSTVFGYGYGSSRGATRYVVYVESQLRQRRHTKVNKDSPFADLRYALYLGRRAVPDKLLITSELTPTLHGHKTVATVPFGTATLTLVIGSRGSLGGRYADQRWWVVLVLGAAVALGAGVLTDRLVKRRRKAEALTNEIDALLRDQRSIAESLQRALVPDGLPTLAGLDLGARYLPGVNGVEIGGDWYDIVPVDDTHVFFAVGDVSGRGIEAGSVMAALHFAIRAYASEGHDPVTVLHLLGSLLTMPRDRHFATVVCGLIDVETGTVTVANAGHLPMLIVDGPDSRFVQTRIGPPIGVQRGARYESTTVELPPGATLLAYTDGLVEQRGETLDDGLARLRAAASHTSAPIDAMLNTILAELQPAGSDDDTAVLAIRLTHRTAAARESRL
ncbi:PP2C family protein-serine/threonine phosphatase [uncultured Jatrophihabitans sp.]|uniref:PP2C family protein-serine/threonine phosphatase n=1 Tax=uncultured Jatrophihabitans sp. TaxID=1610747 RepID=UPI0035CC7448